MKSIEMQQKKKLFDDLINSHLNEMLRFTISRVSIREEAEDIVQDAFLDAFKYFENFEGRSSHKTWLFSILKNKILDFHRKRFRSQKENIIDIENLDHHPVYFDENGSWKKQFQPHDWPVESDTTDLLQYLKTCIETLQIQLLSALKLKYFEELSSELICQELNISKTNYWQILHRARLQLRGCIEKKLYDSGNKVD